MHPFLKTDTSPISPSSVLWRNLTAVVGESSGLGKASDLCVANCVKFFLRLSSHKCPFKIISKDVFRISGTSEAFCSFMEMHLLIKALLCGLQNSQLFQLLLYYLVGISSRFVISKKNLLNVLETEPVWYTEIKVYI